MPDRKIYKCFGCGKGGGAINFVMELDNLSFREAVEVLAKRCGMEVPDSGYAPGAKERREKLLTINKQAARAFTAGCTPRRGPRDWRTSKSEAYPKGP